MSSTEEANTSASSAKRQRCNQNKCALNLCMCVMLNLPSDSHSNNISKPPVTHLHPPCLLFPASCSTSYKLPPLQSPALHHVTNLFFASRRALPLRLSCLSFFLSICSLHSLNFAPSFSASWPGAAEVCSGGGAWPKAALNQTDPLMECEHTRTHTHQ